MLHVTFRTLPTSELRRSIPFMVLLVLAVAILASAPKAFTQASESNGTDCAAMQVPQHPLAAECTPTPQGQGSASAVPTLPATHTGPAHDTDHDGLSDEDERTIYKTDPRQADTDGDGLKDGEEVALALNPHVVDSDGDGLGDMTEYLGLGTNPLQADTDGDGLADGVEVSQGSDPNDPASPVDPTSMG